MEKEFDIKIQQTREGFVKQMAETPAQALNIVSRRYQYEGHELPDMEDGLPLRFSVEGSEQILTAPSQEQVIAWFKKNGRPDWDSEWIQEFISPTDEQRKEQYWEAVINEYDLCDFDRWQHFQNVICTECSWNCFLNISNALYQEDIEILELGYGDSQHQPEKAPQKATALDLDSIIAGATSRQINNIFSKSDQKGVSPMKWDPIPSDR